MCRRKCPLKSMPIERFGCASDCNSQVCPGLRRSVPHCAPAAMRAVAAVSVATCSLLLMCNSYISSLAGAVTNVQKRA